jgi:hypothetical protein|tara:strand:+ start:930 stop:2735 length:1806 start_codon:yes stop_codon:yes gene_type:complete
MSKKGKKRINKKKFLKKENTSTGIISVLFVVALLALFSETVRTIPAGAFSEKFIQKSFEVPKLNSELIEKKILNKSLLVTKNADYQKTKDKIIISEENIISKTEIIEKKEEIFIAKAPETIIQEIDTKILNEEKIEDVIADISKVEEIESKTVDQKILDVPKIEETIMMAADTSTTIITVEGEEKLIPGTLEKNITYMQILQKPNDLELNLKYAQQQGKAGNYKQTISTLERLNMLYPENVEIKLYLLSVLVQADSPNKALAVIEEIKNNEDTTSEDLITVNEIEAELKERVKPRLWNFYADLSIGGIHNENVNSVSKTRLQSSSDSVIGFNSAKYDRTYSGGLGFTATRSLGEASSFMINVNTTDSDQEEETGDDFESYGLTFALDTSLGNQSLSPYLMISKTDYRDDADSFSFMYGIGGSFSAGESHSFSYGYSFADSKGNQNSTDDSADETNSIGHSFSLGHDFMFSELTSTSISLGYSDSDAKVDAGNDYETYDLGFRLNFAFPWAYISIGDALSFNEYKKEDTSINSNIIRSDVTNTFDIMFTKSVGDIFPAIDPNRNFFINLGYEKLISEGNIINYDYIAESFSMSFSKSFHLNK